MFRHHTRKLVLALSLFAAVGSFLPGAQSASASPITTAPLTEVRWDLEQVDPPTPTKTIMPSMLIISNMPVQQDGTTMTYSFRVWAYNGPAQNVKVTLGTHTMTPSGGPSSAVTRPAVDAGNMAASETRVFSITCDPPKNQYCNAGVIKVESSGHQPVYGWDDTDGPVKK